MSRRNINEHWRHFQGSSLWRRLRSVRFLRSGVYLAIELGRSWQEPARVSQETLEQIYQTRPDPMELGTDPVEQIRFTQQTIALDQARAGELFRSGLDLGCGEGWFTEVLADRCESLLALDLSPTAVARARHRRPWPEQVRFQTFDLSREEIPGKFDVIVVAEVLEYFTRPPTHFRIRKKLVEALQPDGCILVSTPSRPEVIENSWWGRLLIRGKWINAFIASHPALAVVSTWEDDHSRILVCRNVGRRQR